ncbi:MAG TPA: pyridoxal-dependent decarboxylase, exosortase A system-associated, partial [Candidatus Tenderia electrophaga]|nr:pyridoxal-dependent decarboxylase, exosortase A system-associated [Candidatus Tenderia electrophaga]
MKHSKPIHPPMPQFSVENDCLHAGRQAVTQLAQRVGTPFYVYDREIINRRVAYLRNSFPNDLHLHYAIKANSMPALVQHMATLIDGFDLASAGEMQIALDTPMPTDKISFAGPGKRPEELEAAVAAGIVINMESDTEMQRITDIAQRSGIRPKVAIRVNPDFELKSSGMKMGGGPKQFGIDAELVPAMLNELKQRDLEFYGFHIFSGSQNLKADAIMETHEKTFALAQQLAEHAPSPVKLLNIGGGLGIPYFPGDDHLDLKPIGENLDRLLPGVKANLPEAEIVTELGRYLVGEAGLYICRIIDRKVSRGETFLITDGGMHHHLAASGNFGQFVRKNYPVVIANKVKGEIRETVNIVGPLCTPLDILADKMELSKADIGDLVAVYQSGAYG